MRDKIGERPYDVTKKGDVYSIRFYPMKKDAKQPDRILFCLNVSKKEFDKMAAKIK